jgi:hypothetical protein
LPPVVKAADRAINATTKATGISGRQAIANLTLAAARLDGEGADLFHAIQEPVIEMARATGNVTTAKTIAHTRGFASDPGASNAIGAPTSAINNPGTVRIPQTTVTTIGRIGRCAEAVVTTRNDSGLALL